MNQKGSTFEFMLLFGGAILIASTVLALIVGTSSYTDPEKFCQSQGMEYTYAGHSGNYCVGGGVAKKIVCSAHACAFVLQEVK